MESKKKLIEKAIDIYKDIKPCGSKESFSECFTEYGDKIFFWFDTEDHSTHILMEEI